VGFLVGAAYGSSTLNGGDEFIVHMDADQSDPLPRAHLNGWSIHGEMAFNREQWLGSKSGFMADLYDTFNPFVSLTYASQENVPGYVWGRDREEYLYEKDTSGTQDETGTGWEAGLANIIFYRQGHVKALYGDINADTWGVGANLQFKDMFGARYDRANVPQARGLPEVVRHTWSFWVDPLAIMAD